MSRKQLLQPGRRQRRRYAQCCGRRHFDGGKSQGLEQLEVVAVTGMDGIRPR